MGICSEVSSHVPSVQGPMLVILEIFSITAFVPFSVEIGAPLTKQNPYFSNKDTASETPLLVTKRSKPTAVSAPLGLVVAFHIILVTYFSFEDLTGDRANVLNSHASE